MSRSISLIMLIAGMCCLAMTIVHASSGPIRNATSSMAVSSLPHNTVATQLTRGSGMLVLDFGNVQPGDTLTRGALLTSVGDGDLDNIVVDPITGPDAALFEMIEDNCTGAVLPPQHNCDIWISFTPQEYGEYSAQFQVHSSDTFNPTMTVLLEGVSIEDAIFMDRFE